MLGRNEHSNGLMSIIWAGNAVSFKLCKETGVILYDFLFNDFDTLAASLSSTLSTELRVKMSRTSPLVSKNSFSGPSDGSEAIV